MKPTLLAATLLAIFTFAVSPSPTSAQEPTPVHPPTTAEMPGEGAPPAVASLPEKAKFHLYLLIGQSNMAGRGALDAESKTPDPRVLMLDKENRWVPATDPLNFSHPGKDAVGPGLSFGKAMASANPSVTIGLIPCAVGGTPISRWIKGGPLYAAAVARTHEASKAGELKGILWHQGESDSKDDKNASVYAERLTGMVAALRAEFNQPHLPFVAGELGTFLLETNLPFWKKVNEAILTLPKSVPHTAVVSSTGLEDKGDNLHFNTAAEREFGKRYAEVMLSLQKTP